jgi:ribonuclease E
MLVNATQAEELRVAMVDGQKLYDLSIEIPSREQKKGNIYKARIARVEPSLEACFVDYGSQRHGFLPLKEVSKEYFRQQPQGGRMLIRELLNEGQELMVQVEKEERGNKGAALTTFISLAGRFLVLMPNNPRAGGVSRRIEGEERDQMRETMAQLVVPEGMGAIVRTAGVGRAAEELQWDLDNMRTQWDAIDAAYKARSGAFLVYQESDAVTRALRDYLGDDIGEILVDDPAAYQKAQEYMQRAMPPDAQRKLKLYTDDIPLFTRFQIESQIESAYAHKVQLPSGGSLVIDYTEALVSIDINSARATRGSDIETTATNTNLEAADEIARQLRIRDIGGLIVIDFIDMEEGKNQRAVEDRLRDAMKMDRARIQIGRLSRFGLLEMSRQRLRPSLGESSHLVCPRCNGIGSIRSVESLALSILRLIGEDARKDRTARIIVQVPVDVATYLINEKRDWLRELGDKAHTDIVVVPNPHIQTPEYSIRRVRDDEAGAPENTQISYQIPQKPEVADPTAAEKKPATEPAAVQPLMPATAAPIVIAATPEPPAEALPPKRALGLVGWMKRLIVGDPQPAAAAEERPGHGRRDGRASGQRPARDERRDRGDRGRDRDRHRDRDRGDRGERGARGERGDRQGQPRRDEPRRGEGRRDEPRRDDQRRNEPRGQEPRRQEPRREEPRRDDGRREIEVRSEEVPGMGAGPGVAAQPGGESSGPRPEGERGERSGRSRRGGRRRRRGGGGGREGMTQGGGAEGGAAQGDGGFGFGGGDENGGGQGRGEPSGGDAGGGGSQEPRPAQFDFGPPATPEPRPAAPPAAAAPAPQPSAAPAAAPADGAPARPHVVWSSAPSGSSWSGDSRRDE